MAEAVVKLLIEHLASFPVDEFNLLGGVRQEVEQISNDLRIMSACLKDAETRKDPGEGVKEWVRQVRELAFDAEDVLAEFLLRMGAPHDYSPGFIGFLRRSTRFIKELKARHQIATQIQDIKLRMGDITRRRAMFSFSASNQDPSSSSSLSIDTRGVSSLYVTESELVGIDTIRNDLTKRLTEGESSLTVISVIGEGGVGKTALVRKVYESQRVKEHFSCYAWIIVSQSFDAEKILKGLIKQHYKRMEEPLPEGLETMNYEELVQRLREYLAEKRYVVILDDIWSVNVWPHLKCAFPENKKSSRIIVTTRNQQVASSCTDSHKNVYKFRPLDASDAWELFCKKAFSPNNGGTCPPHLEGLCRDIVKRCGGLPLAIVAIGGLLSKKILSEWESVYHSLGTEIAILNELVARSLIQASKVDYSGRVTRCQVNNLILDLIIEKSVEENFSMSFAQVNTGLKQAKPRRLSICKEDSFDVWRQDSRFTNVCSAFLLEVRENPRPLLSSFRLLKVLTLTGRKMSRFPSAIVNLFHLRYLNMRETSILEIPNSIGKLQNLQTLDLKHTLVTKLPKGILKLKQLRHLFVWQMDILGAKLPTGIGCLNCLENLFLVDVVNVENKQVVKELGKLTQLRRLGIINVRREDMESLCDSICNMNQLQSLYIRSSDVKSEGPLDELSLSKYALPLLRSIHLDGHLPNLTNLMPSFQNLVKLKLKWSRLRDDPLKSLQDLQYLAFLQLGAEVYTGDNLSCEGGGFPSLRVLLLLGLDGLRCVRFEEGAMPVLEKLGITKCKSLEKVPIGIRHLTSLKFLDLKGNSEKLEELIIRSAGGDWATSDES